MFGKTKVYIDGFGKKYVTFYQVENTKDLLVLSFQHNNIKYSAVCDKEIRILTPISDNPLLEIFSTYEYNDYCFTFVEKETENPHSYHIKKEEDGLFYPITHVQGGYDTTCRLIGTDKNNYWFIESKTNDITEYSLYDVQEHKIITPPFSEISFEQEDGPIFAFVRKSLIENINGEDIILENVMSFIDENGNFVTDLFCIESDMRISAKRYNFDKSFKSFQVLMSQITIQQEKKFQSEKNHIDQVLEDMFNNPYSKEENLLSYQKTKIIQLDRRRHET